MWQQSDREAGETEGVRQVAQIFLASDKLFLKKDWAFDVFEFILKLSLSGRCIGSDEQTIMFIIYKLIIYKIISSKFSGSVTLKSQGMVS